jgi:leucine dehydrogenase
MAVFETHSFDQHEEVLFCNHAKTGLKAIIAIHNTNLGPALGGCRMWPYETSDKALEDVLRLSKGMTYKAAMAKLPLGGGKAVIMGHPKHHKTKDLLLAMAEFVDHLGGRYITAEDVGTTVEDMEVMLERTPHVVGTKTGGSGDPSPATSFGVFTGIKSAVNFKLKRKSLEGLRVAIQGLGHVGMGVCEFLAKTGAELYVTDLQKELVDYAVENFKAKAVGSHEILAQEVDVFTPCALGSVINDSTINLLKCQIIAGAANNQLAEPYHGDLLTQKGILYAPDYVINTGGLINVYYEQQGYNREKAFNHIGTISETLTEIFETAETLGISTSRAADQIAEKRFLKTTHNSKNN